MRGINSNDNYRNLHIFGTDLIWNDLFFSSTYFCMFDNFIPDSAEICEL